MVYRRGTGDMSGYDHELEGDARRGAPRREPDPVAFVRGTGGSSSRSASPWPRTARHPGTEHDLTCDLVALAIGQSKLRSLASELPGVALDKRGCVVVDPATGATGNPRSGAAATARTAARRSSTPWPTAGTPRAR